MATPKPARAPFRLTALSLAALSISWILIFIARSLASSFQEAASNAMISLLWVGAAVTVVGVVLAVMALGRRESNRLLTIASLILNGLTLAFFLVIGLSAGLMSM